LKKKLHYHPFFSEKKRIMSSFDANIEHAWCQQLLQNKERKISALLNYETFVPLTTIKRQRFDCRTGEAKQQRDILKLYERRLLELDARIEEITKTRFASICNRQASQHFIDFVGGNDVYEKFERRLSSNCI
jgi:hypothetical protein